MGKRYSAKGPLRNEAAVRELLALMDEYNAPGRKELAAMVSQIGVLERQLDDAAKQIAAMRQELAEVRQGPVKRALLAAVHGLEKGVSALGARLDELKLSAERPLVNTVADSRGAGRISGEITRLINEAIGIRL